MVPSKRDWKLFREKVGFWRERYMEKLLQEYVEYLKSDSAASVKFWELEKRIKKDKRRPGVFSWLNKNTVITDIVCLIQDGTITFDDLEGFSDDLINKVKSVMDDSFISFNTLK
ncbi:MAG: multidrug transporter [Erysipelotrichaceae bacterium]|nr:multidrug transporter [Erysipelotrichaceae bacterium]